MLMNTIRLIILLPLLAASALGIRAHAQSAVPLVGYKLLSPERTIAKIAYLTGLFDRDEELKALFAADPTLSRIARNRYARLSESGDVTAATLSSLLFSDEEVSLIGDRLVALLEESESLRQLYHDHVAASGCYTLYTSDLPDDEALRAAWAHDARAINRVIGVYGRGDKPLYAIDSISWVAGSEEHLALVRESRRLLMEAGKDRDLFYFLPYYAAELFLDLNDRDEPSVFEPLWETENAEGYRRVAHTKWDDYPYSALLVLGYGPTNYDFPLNPGGKIRLRIAAEKFKQGIAPFLIVSGGKVYPYKTRRVEAYGMKQYLIEECGIPADRILIEPHARHTTSNIRNTVRILYRAGFPMDKPFLVSSSKSHIDYVMSERFEERCRRDMGLVPCRFVRRTEDNFAELLPLAVSLQINDRDPLDA